MGKQTIGILESLHQVLREVMLLLLSNIWASDNGLDPAATKTDDPDGDGIVNLMEYALSSNPIATSRGDLPQIAMQTLDLEDQPKEYITYSFTRQGQTNDLIYSVEVSEDLKEWKKALPYWRQRQLTRMAPSKKCGDRR